MTIARVIAVNTGREADLVVGGRPARTAIDKRSAAGRVPVRALGLTGDKAEVIDRPAERVTIAESMRAYYGDQHLMRRGLRVPGRGETWDAIGQQVLGRTTV